MIWPLLEPLPKAQRTRRLSSAYQSNFFRSFHKFSKKSWPYFIFIISTKQQLQPNIFDISAFPLNLNFKILTKRSFRISTKNNLHYLNQESAAKCWLNFNFKISPEPQLQNLDQTLLKVGVDGWSGLGDTPQASMTSWAHVVLNVSLTHSVAV